VPNWCWTEYFRMTVTLPVRSLLVYPVTEDLSRDLDISVTAHSGWINAFLRVIGRNDYALPTGGILVVVVKRKVSYVRSTKDLLCFLFRTFRARFSFPKKEE